MPSLDVSELNIVLGVLGTFIVLYGWISVKIKAQWYLGEALPAVVFGIMLGPIAAKFLDADRWGSAAPDQMGVITLGVARVVIGVQLVIAGFQLPAKYQLKEWIPMMICLLPVMTIMWLFTTGCILLTVPKLTLLTGLVIGSCVTCTDPILSQAIAKGPFADKYVPRALREIISSEAGANDGFGFPFLMLATYLIRYANVPGAGENSAEKGAELAGNVTTAIVERAMLHVREEDVGRLGGGVGIALGTWATETWVYIVFLSVLYGIVVGYGSAKIAKFSLRRKWIDTESYLLMPTGLGLFLIGTCGAIGTDDLLACFVAGNAINWDGNYLAETEALHDEVNSCIDVLLNFGGFMYIGVVMPFSDFHQPDTTGLTIPRLIGLGFLVLIFRRIPAIFMTYKFMPSCVKDWKEALFMGYFGPIGIGAVFYIEHTKHLFPEKGQASDAEVNNMTAVMVPVVYWLVLFSIVIHGLSIPALNLIYKWRGVPAIQEDDPTEILMLSNNAALPKNSKANPNRKSILVHNRFSAAPRPDISAPSELSRWNSAGDRQVFRKRDSMDSIDLEKLRQIQ
ncbi:Na(+)/H(+) antiporter 1 [Cadophora sp. DSE1049]|nr:Na(+)/H(+) antiporter 1 [Cadophora sp. DSE1049]